MSKPFEFTGRIRSFTFAFAGIWTMLKSQHNAWIHAFATVAVIAGGTFFQVSVPEWCCLILAIIAVWSAEALNTAFEFLADVASPEFHPLRLRASAGILYRCSFELHWPRGLKDFETKRLQGPSRSRVSPLSLGVFMSLRPHLVIASGHRHQ